MLIGPGDGGVAELLIELGDAAGEGEHQADGGVGDFFGAVVGDVGDRDASGRGGAIVDVVVAHAAAHDEAAMLKSRDGIGRDRDGVELHDGIGVFDAAHEVGFGVGLDRVDVGDVGKDALLGGKAFEDEVGNGNLETRHGAHIRVSGDLFDAVWQTTKAIQLDSGVTLMISEMRVATSVEYGINQASVTARDRLMKCRPASLIAHQRTGTVLQHPERLRDLTPTDKVVEERFVVGCCEVDLSAMGERRFGEVKMFAPHGVRESVSGVRASLQQKVKEVALPSVRGEVGSADVVGVGPGEDVDVGARVNQQPRDVEQRKTGQA